MPRTDKVRIHAVVLAHLRRFKDSRRRLDRPDRPWLADGPILSGVVSYAVLRWFLEHPDPEVRQAGMELEFELGPSEVRLLRRLADPF